MSFNPFTTHQTGLFLKDVWPAFLKWLRPDNTTVSTTTTCKELGKGCFSFDASVAMTYRLPGRYPDVTVECGENGNLRDKFASAKFNFTLSKFLASIKATASSENGFSFDWNVSTDGVIVQ